MRRHRAAGVTLLVVVAVLVRVGFLPLFGGLGYEYALACGLLLPGAAAVWTALVAAAEREDRPVVLVLRGLGRGLALTVVAILIGLLHGLRAGLCDLSGGLVAFSLGPGAGALLGGAWGALVAMLVRRRKRPRAWGATLAVLGPLATAAGSVARFYTSPMIFAYDPFVGYFSGTLYDTVVTPGLALWSYRAGSLAVLVGTLLFASTLEVGAAGLRFELGRGESFWVRLTTAALLFAAVGVEMAFGAELGHWSTAETIARALGGTQSGARCDVVYPSTLQPAEVALLVKDCDEELAEVTHTLAVPGPPRIRAFFFKDAAEKKRLMGAADTYIAKPWRTEVYLQVGPYPHPVLGHEIAHVVAGTFGRGPFRVAGPLGGLLPNPGLIEGLAVATSPDEDDLTDIAWAAAMKRRGALPPMRTVFSAGFLGQSAQKSYTLAGAFVRWLMTTRGVGPVRAWYAGESPEEAFGTGLDALDQAFRAALDQVPLPSAAEAYVASKFERPSVFGRRCPHEVDALRRSADTCRDAHQVGEARERYGEALALDPTEPAVLLARAVMELRYGDAAEGRREAVALAGDDRLPLAARHKARDALADDELLTGDPARAADAYAALAQETPDEDAARTLEVKALAARDPEARPAVTALLVATPERRPPDPQLAAALLGLWEGAHPNALASYLLGKSFASKQSWAEAAERFAVLEREPVSPRVDREALRQRAIAACALGDTAAVEHLRGLAGDPHGVYAGSAGGRQDNVVRLLRRCAPPP